MTEQQNTPELRFPEFKDKWKDYQLKDVIKVNSGKDYKHLTTGKYPVYGTGGYMLSVSNYLYENDAIGIGRKGTINKPYLLKGPFWTVDTLFYCTPLKENNLYFILNLFRKINWKKYDESTGVPSLSKITINKVKCKIPPTSEQIKIGNFFSKLDRQIELEEEKLELLEAQKKGYMQKLFSQEMRFKDNKENNYPDWKIVKIGDILEERNERSGEGDMLSVTINHGIIKFDEIDRKDNSSKDKSNYRKVYKDDIAYNSMRMWQGASGKSEYDGIVSPAYTVTIPNESINPDFIAYYFKTHKMIHKFKINSQGLTSDTWNLKYRQLKDIKINLCSKDEQNKIANLLITYDKLINKQKHKLEILKTNKKGFLQKMFV
ncbi:restriction endonuclease subunit S [Staphylococcus croceilyticus]|uniref:Restriction endonuclease subunit S n=1 Tax=Staphylococcus croceilyticus TaxID=319942 RepID=A0ABY2KG27_9STAP|nr:restriction endonuclease subunit S [Staphylococcus croceilyticus]PNZ70606.1 restriction endonuclease subunit S [Staphylococcus croceilyticus]TGA80984.1 restriction endonuclease subunit S [Staphylococcus croceilyticus]